MGTETTSPGGVAVARKGAELQMIGGAIGKRAEMKRDPVVEPVVLPMIFLGDFVHDRLPANPAADGRSSETSTSSVANRKLLASISAEPP